MSELEIYYELTYKIFAVLLINIITSVAYAYFCIPFVENIKNAIAVGLAYFIIINFMKIIPTVISNVAAYGSSVFAGFLVMCILDKKRILQKIFLAVVFFTERWIVLAINRCIIVWIEKFFRSMSGFQEDEVMQFWAFFVECIIENVIIIILFFGIAWVIRKTYKYNTQDMTIKEFILMILPSMSGLIGYVMFKLYSDTYLNDTGHLLVEISNKFNIMCLLYYIISLGTIVVCIVLFQNIKEKQEEQQQNEHLNNQIESMKQHISEVERLYQDIRCLRHDMGNHIMTLEALYASGEHEAADEYMKELKYKFIDTDNGINSGNPVTDVILLEKRREAQDKSIEFLCDFHYPNKIQQTINAFDISVILNNALDNAIKAAVKVQKSKGRAKIVIKTQTKHNIFILKIENSFEGDLNVDKNGLIISKYNNKEGHGYGLRNIKNVAQKYCGDISVEYNKNIFRLNVMLVQ